MLLHAVIQKIFQKFKIHATNPGSTCKNVVEREDFEQRR